MVFALLRNRIGGCEYRTTSIGRRRARHFSLSQGTFSGRRRLIGVDACRIHGKRRHSLVEFVQEIHMNGIIYLVGVVVVVMAVLSVLGLR